MQVKTERKDSVNISVKVEVDNSAIEAKVDKLVKKYAKNMKINGFRKGKVPTAIVKSRFGDEIKQESRNELLRDAFTSAKSDLKIEDSKVLGEPRVIDFKDEGEGFKAELKIELRPDIELGKYDDLVPEFKVAEVSDEEVEERLKAVALSSVLPEKIEKSRALKNGDFAKFDFEGFIDGVPFEGGKAEGYLLEIGSKGFIEGFEEQMVGMKESEEKEITVKFPENYGKAELAGKDATFKIKLLEIQEKKLPALDNELAKSLLPNEENPTIETVRDMVKKQIENEKLSKLYNEELKPQLIELFIENINFDLPETIIEQEIDIKVNQELQTLERAEAEKIVADEKEVEKLREKHKEDATKSVKATFIMDELARAEKVGVSDNEVYQTIYYEAMSMGQDPGMILEYYQKNNVLPAIKMGIIEDKILNKLLNRKIGRE